MIWTRAAHQSAKFQTIDCSCEVSPGEMCFLIGLFYWKYIKFRLRIYTDELCLMALKSDAKFKEQLIYWFNTNKNMVNVDLSTRISQNLHFDWFLFCKKYNVRPKKVQRSYFSWYWRLIQSLMEQFLQIFTRTLQILKIGTLIASFYPK